MERTDVLVVGGSAAGVVAATTAKATYPDKRVVLIRKDELSLVPCGIPYVFGSLDSTAKNLMPNDALAKAGVELRIAEVVSIDQEAKTCLTAQGEESAFDKLVIATGSEPVVPPWLPGTDLAGVYTIPKNKAYIDRALESLRNCRAVVTIGGGFIGVEMSDELNKQGIEVTLVEILPHILGLAFDEEIAVLAQDILQTRGVNVKTGAGVKAITGEGRATGVLLDNGQEVPTEAVVLSVGYRPAAGLAAESGIELNERGSIKVDEYMRTQNPDIFAVGDCAEKRDFTTRKLSSVMLASTATSEARVAGMNLYRLSAVKTFSGTIAIWSTGLGEHGFGCAGLTERAAREEGFDVVTGMFEGIDKHPGTLPGAHKQLVKLVAASDSGVILGGQVAGGPSAGELTNLIGLAIQNRMVANSLVTAQIGTHPLLTAPPTAYPVIKAAEQVLRKMSA